MTERLTLRQLDDEIRQLAATLREMPRAPRQGPREPLAETPYSRAIQCIHRGLNQRQDVMAGKFDSDIHTLLTSYLSSKYPGASQESIRHHAESSMRRKRSWFKVAAANVGGTVATGLLTSIAPKLGLYLGFNASALGAGLGLTVGSALVPAVLASLPIAGAYGATRIARRMTRDERESRKAGNILKAVIHEGPEMMRLRAAVASGKDLFREFDELIKKNDRIPEKYSDKLWTLGMLGVGGILGIFGAGSFDIAQKIYDRSTSADLADWRNMLSQFSKEFFYKDANNPGAWQTGVQELTGLGKYIWIHAGAAVGLWNVPDYSIYQRGFPR